MRPRATAAKRINKYTNGIISPKEAGYEAF